MYPSLGTAPYFLSVYLATKSFRPGSFVFINECYEAKLEVKRPASNSGHLWLDALGICTLTNFVAILVKN